MTRKDYILLAGALLESKRLIAFAGSNDPAINRIQTEASERTLARTVEEIADVLKRDNSAFKRDLFVAAATGQCKLTARRA